MQKKLYWIYKAKNSSAVDLLLKKQQDAKPDSATKKSVETPVNKGPSSVELLEQQLQAERELELAKELEKIKKEKEKLLDLQKKEEIVANELKVKIEK